jgi:hypothetical protein
MAADRRQFSRGGPTPCPCCGAWSLPGQRTCFGCREHAVACHRYRLPLQRLEATLDELVDASLRWGRSRYGGRAA